LRQIGLVDRADGLRLRETLRPGQRLVSREGDFWRWDGLTSAAEAPSPAARRLAERNRLGDLERDAAAARTTAEAKKAEADAAQTAVLGAAAAETAAIVAAGAARRALDGARERLAAAERREADLSAKRSARQEGLARLAANEAEARERIADAERRLGDLSAAPDLDNHLLAARAAVAERRVVASDARAALQTLIREAEMAARRRQAIGAENASWTERAERAGAAAADLGARLARLRDEQGGLKDAPDDLILRRRALLSAIAEAEGRRKEAADRLAEGETAQAAADGAARAALEAFAAARESRAGSQARHEAAVPACRRAHPRHRRQPRRDPSRATGTGRPETRSALPRTVGTEARLNDLKSERERLGAGQPARRGGTLRDGGQAQRAHGRARRPRRGDQAAAPGDRQPQPRGRERLLAAFGVVNGHFQKLFTTLFGGGTA
jgi:chromosome segregation protein